MKKKITSAEYQSLPIQLRNRYTRYCGSDEVYYELLSSAHPVKEGDKNKWHLTLRGWQIKKESQIKVGDTSITKLADGCLQVVTKNGCVELYPEEIAAIAQFTNSNMVEVEKVIQSIEDLTYQGIAPEVAAVLIQRILT